MVVVVATVLNSGGRGLLCHFSPECRCSEEESCAECLHDCSENQTCVRDLLRLLAEIRFIDAEVCAHYLLLPNTHMFLQ